MRWVRVDEEGDDSQFFDEADEVGGEEEVQNGSDMVMEDGTQLPPEVFQFQYRRPNTEDLANIQAMGFGVDDDNEPAPENVPPPNLRVETTDEGWLQGQSWGWAGFCNRKKEGGVREKAKMNKKSSGFVQMFLLFFPQEWLEEVVIKQMKQKEGMGDLTLGLFLKWLGIWLLLATTIKMERKKCWSSMPVSRKKGAPF